MNVLIYWKYEVSSFVTLVFKMKIAIVGVRGIPNNYGGFETLTEYLSVYLSKENEVQVYCSSSDMDSRLKSYLGAKLIYIPISSHGALGILYDSFSLIHAALTCRKIILLGFGGGFILPMLGKKKKDVIVNIGGLDWQREKWSKFAQRVIHLSERGLLKNAGQIVADNKGIADYIYDTYKRECHLIAYGGDQVKHQPVNDTFIKKYPFLKSKYAFIVTRVQKDNNLEMMLQAFIDNPPLPFVIIGNWDATKYGRYLKSTYGGTKYIIMLDPIYDKIELDLLRSNCTVYVHGHSAGGTNPTLVEAMSLGLPIFSFSSVFNQFTTFNQALYFKDSIELRALIDRHSNIDLSQIGKNLKDLAQLHYCWENITNEYNKVLML